MIKYFHAGLALVSGFYFASRGLWKIGLGRKIQARIWKILPHIIDTLLLVSGMALAIMQALNPSISGWLLVKLGLVVLYIVIGITAFRCQRPLLSWFSYIAALLVWFWILGIAVHKQPEGWLDVV
ncbi:MAG: SirB2 family protein [Gammaproteobacteria bacterium]